MSEIYEKNQYAECQKISFYFYIFLVVIFILKKLYIYIPEFKNKTLKLQSLQNLLVFKQGTDLSFLFCFRNKAITVLHFTSLYFHDSGKQIFSNKQTNVLCSFCFRSVIQVSLENVITFRKKKHVMNNWKFFLKCSRRIYLILFFVVSGTHINITICLHGYIFTYFCNWT